jgi:hypothetical protein
MPRPPRRAPAAALHRFLVAQTVRALCFAEWCAPASQPVSEWVHGAVVAFCREQRRRRPAGWTTAFWQQVLRRLPAPDPAEDGQDWDELAAPEMEWDQALRALPLAMRQVFLLRVWIGLDIGHCATVMDSSDGLAKTRLYHAMQRLRAMLPDAAAGPGEGWVVRCRSRLEEHADARSAHWRAQADPIVAAALADSRPRPPQLWPWAVSAAALLLAVLLVPRWGGSERGPIDPDAAAMAALEQPARVVAEPIEQALSLPPEDFALLADPADFELLAELEFHRWLAETRRDD